ncbi:hypothetical protein CEXT_269541 [Caerostris extrusa]|uniref:Uncharacterized protein n=1 Tax=Caerostris extrusa TaxID=172846 RepID=A0AAV4MUY9_CAEEX|nr:hypothetical protein CEXT_269541 [Caerostris extrusa]
MPYYLGTTQPGELCGRRTHFEHLNVRKMVRFSNSGIMGAGIFLEFPESGATENEYERRIRGKCGIRVDKLKNPRWVGASE